MGKAAVELMLFLMDEAFATNREHSLLANLRTVKDDEWRWTPADGGRSIFEIVQHVGECKYAYDNHAFGDRSMRWIEADSIPSISPDDTPADIIDWLTNGQDLLREHVAALDDDELLKPRMANWGQEHETRWLLSVLIEHDLYHSGEINHVRALIQGNDTWAWPSNR